MKNKLPVAGTSNSSSVNVQVSFAHTPAGKKNFRITAKLQHEMERIARLVAQNELSGIEEFRLSIVLMSDEELLEINRFSLGHDWLTDIVTFEIERDRRSLEAELYISVDRAVENANRYRQVPEVEFLHLVIHGVLHLAGYEDKTPGGTKRMRERERWYLVQFHSAFAKET